MGLTCSIRTFLYRNETKLERELINEKTDSQLQFQDRRIKPGRLSVFCNKKAGQSLSRFDPYELKLVTYKIDKPEKTRRGIS